MGAKSLGQLLRALGLMRCRKSAQRPGRQDGLTASIPFSSHFPPSKPSQLSSPPWPSRPHCRP